MKLDRIVCFDFDGVIHSYTSKWVDFDVILDPPVPGIKEAIEGIRKAGYKVHVHSSRCAYPEGLIAVEAWLNVHKIEVDGISATKPVAMAIIDDRAICFDGDSGTLLDKIENFRPWYRQDHAPWEQGGHDEKQT